MPFKSSVILRKVNSKSSLTWICCWVKFQILFERTVCLVCMDSIVFTMGPGWVSRLPITTNSNIRSDAQVWPTTCLFGFFLLRLGRLFWRICCRYWVCKRKWRQKNSLLVHGYLNINYTVHVHAHVTPVLTCKHAIICGVLLHILPSCQWVFPMKYLLTT